MKQPLFTFNQLKAQNVNQHIPYQTLLGTQEWKAKRDAIVKRDGEKCTKCGCKPTVNVWHDGKMYYLLYVPSDPKDLIEIGGIKYRGDAFGDDIHQLYAAVVLHVHHLYYINSCCPWEYDNDALVTLCNDCHLEIHKKETIPVYRIESGSRIEIPVETCSRCHGAGYFPQYKNVENGVCFQCKGRRYTNMTL